MAPAAAAAVALTVLPAAPTQHSTGHPQVSPPHALVAPAIALQPVQAPDGSFNAEAPAGWSMTVSPHDDALTMAPAGKTAPAAAVFIMSVSDLQYQAYVASCAQNANPFGDVVAQCVIPSVRAQLQDSSRPWWPAESLQLVMQRLEGAGSLHLSFERPHLVPVSATQAYYEVRSESSEGPLDHWGTITMYHVPNPMLGPGEVTSLALIAGCVAPAGQAQRWRDACGGILHSVHAAPEWSSRFAQNLAATYVQEANVLVQMGETAAAGFAARQQMISAASEAVRRMQLETFEQRQAAMIHDARHWVAALAGEELVRDPDTGKVYAAPYGYRTYCIDDNSLDPTILAGNDISPGTSVGHHVCTRQLPVEQ